MHGSLAVVRIRCQEREALLVSSHGLDCINHPFTVQDVKFGVALRRVQHCFSRLTLVEPVACFSRL